MGLRAKPAKDFELPTRVKLQRPDEPYEDPSNPNLRFWWKTGMGRYVKTKKYKNGIFLEMNVVPDGEDLLDAYANPVKYGFQNEPEVAEGKWIKKFDPKPYYCVSGWICEWFHLVTYEDERNGEKVSWHERERCTGRECDNCQEEWPKVFGNRFWVDLSYSQWFGPIDAVFEKLERLPKDGGYVWPLHYKCNDEPDLDSEGDPIEGTGGGCGEVITFKWGKGRDRKEVCLDMTNQCGGCGSDDITVNPRKHTAKCEGCDSEWTLLSHEDPKLLAYLASQVKCEHCGHEDYPKPVMAHSDELEEWETYDIYDVQLIFHMVQEGKKRRLNVELDPEILTDDEGDEYEELERPADPRLFDPKLQGEGEAGKAMAEKHEKCINLERVHVVLTPDEQAELIELPNLFDPNREARKQVRKVRYKPREEEEGTSEE